MVISKVSFVDEIREDDVGGFSLPLNRPDRSVIAQVEGSVFPNSSSGKLGGLVSPHILYIWSGLGHLHSSDEDLLVEGGERLEIPKGISFWLENTSSESSLVFSLLVLAS